MKNSECTYDCEYMDNGWECPKDCPILKDYTKEAQEEEKEILEYLQEGYTLDEALEIMRQLQHV